MSRRQSLDRPGILSPPGPFLTPSPSSSISASPRLQPSPSISPFPQDVLLVTNNTITNTTQEQERKAATPSRRPSIHQLSGSPNAGTVVFQPSPSQSPAAAATVVGITGNEFNTTLVGSNNISLNKKTNKRSSQSFGGYGHGQGITSATLAATNMACSPKGTSKKATVLPTSMMNTGNSPLTYDSPISSPNSGIKPPTPQPMLQQYPVVNAGNQLLQFIPGPQLIATTANQQRSQMMAAVQNHQHQHHQHQNSQIGTSGTKITRGPQQILPKPQQPMMHSTSEKTVITQTKAVTVQQSGQLSQSPHQPTVVTTTTTQAQGGQIILPGGNLNTQPLLLNQMPLIVQQQNTPQGVQLILRPPTPQLTAPSLVIHNTRPQLQQNQPQQLLRILNTNGAMQLATAPTFIVSSQANLIQQNLQTIKANTQTTPITQLSSLQAAAPRTQQFAINSHIIGQSMAHLQNLQLNGNLAQIQMPNGLNGQIISQLPAQFQQSLAGFNQINQNINLNQLNSTNIQLAAAAAANAAFQSPPPPQVNELQMPTVMSTQNIQFSTNNHNVTQQINMTSPAVTPQPQLIQSVTPEPVRNPTPVLQNVMTSHQATTTVLVQPDNIMQMGTTSSIPQQSHSVQRTNFKQHHDSELPITKPAPKKAKSRKKKVQPTPPPPPIVSTASGSISPPSSSSSYMNTTSSNKQSNVTSTGKLDLANVMKLCGIMEDDDYMDTEIDTPIQQSQPIQQIEESKAIVHPHHQQQQQQQQQQHNISSSPAPPNNSSDIMITIPNNGDIPFTFTIPTSQSCDTKMTQLGSNLQQACSNQTLQTLINSCIDTKSSNNTNSNLDAQNIVIKFDQNDSGQPYTISIPRMQHDETQQQQQQTMNNVQIMQKNQQHNIQSILQSHQYQNQVQQHCNTSMALVQTSLPSQQHIITSRPMGTSTTTSSFNLIAASSSSSSSNNVSVPTFVNSIIGTATNIIGNQTSGGTTQTIQSQINEIQNQLMGVATPMSTSTTSIPAHTIINSGPIISSNSTQHQIPTSLNQHHHHSNIPIVSSTSTINTSGSQLFTSTTTLPTTTTTTTTTATVKPRRKPANKRNGKKIDTIPTPVGNVPSQIGNIQISQIDSTKIQNQTIPISNVVENKIQIMPIVDNKFGQNQQQQQQQNVNNQIMFQSNIQQQISQQQQQNQASNNLTNLQIDQSNLMINRNQNDNSSNNCNSNNSNNNNIINQNQSISNQQQRNLIIGNSNQQQQQSIQQQQQQGGNNNNNNISTPITPQPSTSPAAAATTTAIFPQLTGSLSLAFADDGGRLLLRHDPNSPQDSQSQLILQAILNGALCNVTIINEPYDKNKAIKNNMAIMSTTTNNNNNNQNNQNNINNNNNNNSNSTMPNNNNNQSMPITNNMNVTSKSTIIQSNKNQNNTIQIPATIQQTTTIGNSQININQSTTQQSADNNSSSNNNYSTISSTQKRLLEMRKNEVHNIQQQQQQQHHQQLLNPTNMINANSPKLVSLPKVDANRQLFSLNTLTNQITQINPMQTTAALGPMERLLIAPIGINAQQLAECWSQGQIHLNNIGQVSQANEQQQQQQSTNNTTPRIQQQIVHPQQHTINSGNINNNSSSSSSNIQPLQQMQQTKQVANVAPIIDASKAKCETTKLPTVKKVTKPRKPKVCHDNSNLNKNLKIQQNSQKVDLNVKTTMNPIQIVQPTTAVSVNKDHNILNRTIGTSSSSSSTSSSSSSISTTTTSTTANIHPFQTQSGTKLIGVTAPMQQITQQRNQCNNTNNINSNNNNSNTNLINSNNITMPPVVSQPGPSITSNQATITLPMSSQSISNNNNNSNNNINNTNISNINSNNNIVNHQLKSQSQQQSQISAPLLNVNTQQTTQPVVPRVQTIQLTPQQQQLLKTVQIQIQQLSAKLQNKSLLETLNIPPDFDPSNPMYNKPLPSLNNIQNMNDSEIHAALQRLFIEQKKILASGKVIPTIAAGTAHAFITSTSMASSNQTVGQSINSSSVNSGASNVTTTQIGTHSGGGTNMTTQEVPSIQNNNSQIVFPQSHQTTKVLTSASSSSLTSSLASTSSVNSMITTTSLSKNDGQPIPANIVQPNNHNTTTNSTTQRIHIYPMQHQIQSQHKTQIIQQQQQQQQHLTSSQISLQQHHNQQQNKIQQQAHIVQQQQQQQIHQQRLQQQQPSPKLLASKQPPSALTVIPITESISTVSSQLASSVPPSSSTTTTTTTTATAVSIKVENVIKVEPLDQQLASLSTTSSQSMIDSPKSKMPRQMLFERFERQIEVDQEGCTKPDYVEPFHSKHDAVKRLIRYHCMYQNDEEVPSDEEDEFEKIAINLQEQFKTISNKFQYLLLEESMRSHRTSELRMIEELIVTDMRKELHEMRNEMNLANTNTGIYQNNNITSSTKTINNLNYNNSAACKVIKKESDIVQQQQPPDQKQLYLQQQKEYNQIQQHNNNLIQQHHHHHHHQQQQQHHNNSQYLIHQQQQYQNNNNNINHQLQQLNQRILNKTTVDTNNSLVKNEIKSEPCDLMFDKCDNINLNTNSNVNNKLNNIMNNHNSNNNRTTPLVRTTNNNSNDTSNPVVSFTHNKLFNNNNEFNSIMIKDEKDNNNVLCNSNLDILPGSVQSISSSSSSSSSSSLNNFTSNSKNYSHKDDPIKEELDNFDIECEIRPSFIMKKIDTTNNNNLIGITSSSSSSSSISSSSSNIGGCGGTTSGTNGQIMSTANLSPITPPSISARTPNVDDVTSNDFPIDYFVNTTHHNNRSSSSSSFSSALPSFTEHLIDGSGGGGQTIVKKKTNNNDCDDANDGLDNDVLTHKTNHETYDEWLCLQKELSFIASEKKSDNLSGITINHHHHHQQQQQLHNNNVSNKYVDKQFTEIFDTSSSSKCVVDNQLSDIFGTSATTTTTTVGPSVDNDNRKTPQEQQQQHHQQQIVTNNLHLSELFSSESITNKSVETRLEAMFGESPVEKTNRDLVETRLEELFSDSPTNSTNNNNNNNSNINVVNSSSQHYSLIGNNDDNENVDAGTVVGGGGGASGVSGKRQWNNSDLLSPNASSSPITTYGKRSCMVNAFIEDAHVTSNHPRWMTDQSFDFTTSSTTATATNGPNDIITNSDIIRKRSWNGDCISNTIEHVTTNKKICYNNHNKHTSDLDEDLLGLDPTTSPEVIANEILHHAIQQQQQQHQHHTNLVQSSNSASGTTINLGHLQHDVHTGNLVQQMQANVLMQMQSGNTHHHNHHHHQLQQQQQQHHHNHQLHIQQQQNHHHHHQMQTNNSLLGPPNVGGNVFDTNNLGSSLNHNPNLSGGSSGSMSSNFDEDINRHVQNAIDSILNLQNSESDSLNFSLDHSMGSFLADSPLDNQNNNGQQQQQQQQHNSVNIIDGGAIVQTSSTSSHHGIISLIGKRRSHNNNHRIDDLGDCLISGIGSNCVNNIVGSGGSSSSSGVGIGDNSNLMIDSPSSVISATTNNGGGGVGGNGLTGGIGDCCGVSGIDDAIKSIMTS